MSLSDRAHEPCESQASDCDAFNGRRDFIRAGLMAVGALATLGVTPDQLSALERRLANGRRVGDELRFPVPAADGATIDEANKVIIARVGGVAMAFVLECPHRGEDVEWQADRGRFYCPKHKSTFRPDGALIGGKARRALDRYPIRRDGDELVVDTSSKLRSTNARAYAAAQVTL